jgi:hypothetical protein
VDDLLCEPNRLNNETEVPSQWDLVDISSANINGAGGVLINGVLLFDSSSDSDVDPYYPKVWSGGTKNTSETVDGCIGHPDGNGNYHYHIMSPCLFNTDWEYSTSICSDVTACSDDMASYVLTGFTAEQDLVVVGVSKDGHPIFGPYTSDG